MNVPRLRFKEFSGEWGFEKLNNFVVERNEYPKDKLPIFSLTIENGVTPKTERYERAFLVNDEENAYKVVIKDDFAYNPMNLRFGAIAKYSGDKPVVVSKYYNIFHCKNTVNTTFCELYFKSYNMIMFYNKMATGSLVEKKRVHFSEFIKFQIPFPTLPEQTKIANFFTAVDKKITQLTQKCDLLTQYKKGVMQQVFSQELRFKDEDGRDFPEWEEKKFGDVFSFIATNSFSRELLTFDDGVVKNIHYGDIHKNFKSNFKIENENVPFINQEVDINKIQKDCYCKEGDLIIADASEDYADIGKSIEIISLDNQKLLAGLHTYIARDLLKQMALGFSGYLMQTESVRLQIKTLATGVSVLGISKGNLAKVILNVPSKPEQTKIANFFAAIDDKITHAQTQLAAMKQYKHGLLQQMFV